jgi:hypothetical protein
MSTKFEDSDVFASCDTDNANDLIPDQQDDTASVKSADVSQESREKTPRTLSSESTPPSAPKKLKNKRIINYNDDSDSETKPKKLKLYDIKEKKPTKPQIKSKKKGKSVEVSTSDDDSDIIKKSIKNSRGKKNLSKAAKKKSLFIDTSESSDESTSESSDENISESPVRKAGKRKSPSKKVILLSESSDSESDNKMVRKKSKKNLSAKKVEISNVHKNHSESESDEVPVRKAGRNALKELSDSSSKSSSNDDDVYLAKYKKYIKESDSLSALNLIFGKIKNGKIDGSYSSLFEHVIDIISKKEILPIKKKVDGEMRNCIIVPASNYVFVTSGKLVQDDDILTEKTSSFFCGEKTAFICNSKASVTVMNLSRKEFKTVNPDKFFKFIIEKVAAMQNNINDGHSASEDSD